MNNLDVKELEILIAMEKEYNNKLEIEQFIWEIDEMKDKSEKLSNVLQYLNRELIDIKEECDHI